MLRRLPISLKIDDEDGDFYYGFIEPKKNDRELSNLILNLLKLYHTNPRVQKEADDFMVSKSPYLKIHEELQRIAFEHSKQTTATGMLGDYTTNEMKKIKQEEEIQQTPTEETKQPEEETFKFTRTELKQLMAEVVAQAQVQTPTPMPTQSVPVEVVTPAPVADIKPIINMEPDVVKPIVEEVKAAETQAPVIAIDGDKPAKPASFGKMLKSVR